MVSNGTRFVGSAGFFPHPRVSKSPRMRQQAVERRIPKFRLNCFMRISLWRERCLLRTILPNPVSTVRNHGYHLGPLRDLPEELGGRRHTNAVEDPKRTNPAGIPSLFRRREEAPERFLCAVSHRLEGAGHGFHAGRLLSPPTHEMSNGLFGVCLLFEDDDGLDLAWGIRG
jgi:hypothetical protein